MLPLIICVVRSALLLLSLACRRRRSRSSRSERTRGERQDARLGCCYASVSQLTQPQLVPLHLLFPSPPTHTQSDTDTSHTTIYGVHIAIAFSLIACNPSASRHKRSEGTLPARSLAPTLRHHLRPSCACIPTGNPPSSSSHSRSM